MDKNLAKELLGMICQIATTEQLVKTVVEAGQEYLKNPSSKRNLKTLEVAAMMFMRKSMCSEMGNEAFENIQQQAEEFMILQNEIDKLNGKKPS